MTPQPLVSIALVVRNVARTVRSAIRSIEDQHLADWELLVIDDGSSDTTPDIVASIDDPRIRVFRHAESHALATRLNEAIDAARGEYFARMDGDDVSYPSRLSLQLEYLRCHPNVDLVGASAMVFDDGGDAIGHRLVPEAHAQICANPRAGFPLVHPTYFGRTAWFRRHRYDPTMLAAQDQELLQRTFRNSQFANVPAILLGYRESDLSVKKLLRTRRHHLGALLRDARKRGEPSAWVGALGTQSAKAIIDIAVVGTGFHRTFYRHRSQPASQTEVSEWRTVWQAATRP